jgi:ABC-type nitrate/sulfonate/bicarbonate transport system permease component
MTAAALARRWEPVVWPLLTGTVLLMAWAMLVKLSGTDVFPSPLSVLRGPRENSSNRDCSGGISAIPCDASVSVTAQRSPSACRLDCFSDGIPPSLRW